MATERLGKLEEALKKYKEQSVLVTGRGPPDPDYISSVLALKHILGSFGIEAHAGYSVPVGRHENRAMMKLIADDVPQLTAEHDFSSYQGIAVVDCQRADALVQEQTQAPLIAIFDHHDKEEGVHADFIDIRKSVGATATLMTDYLKQGALLDDHDESAPLATALLYGIRSDTNSLLKAKHADYVASAYLSRYADFGLLEQVVEQPWTRKTMETVTRAFNSQHVVDNYVLAGVGAIATEREADAIPLAADILSRPEDVGTSVVYGIVGHHVRGSVRTRDAKVRPGQFIEETFPDVLKDKDYGGRTDMGGFNLRLEHIIPGLSIERNPDLVQNVVDVYMRQNFRKALGANGE